MYLQNKKFLKSYRRQGHLKKFFVYLWPTAIEVWTYLWFFSITAATKKAYTSKYPNFPEKSINTIRNLIEIYINFRQGQSHCQSPAGVLVLLVIYH